MAENPYSTAKNVADILSFSTVEPTIGKLILTSGLNLVIAVTKSSLYFTTAEKVGTNNIFLLYIEKDSGKMWSAGTNTIQH